MLKRLRITFTAACALLAFAACDTIRDAYVDCGVWLEFVFDYNMEFADSFDPQVRTVDVYLFDADGVFVRSHRAAVDKLDGRKRMFLRDLRVGKYRVLAVGNLAAPFSFTAGGGFTPGVTTMGQVRLALDTAAASQEFGHLYFNLSETETETEIEYRNDITTRRVPLIRETNRFNVVLQTAAKDIPAGTEEGPTAPIYTVEISAPESGTYDYLNNPTAKSALTYAPWSLLARVEYTEAGTQNVTAAKLNTMRLLENEWNGYRIRVRDIESGEELWSNNLLSLLADTELAKRPDGTDLPDSEYFDRQGDWNIVIIYRDGGTGVNPPSGNAFVAMAIYVNGWIAWENPVGV